MNPKLKHWLFDKEQSSLPFAYFAAVGCLIWTGLWMAQFWVLIEQAPLPVLKGHLAPRIAFAIVFAFFLGHLFIHLRDLLEGLLTHGPAR